MFMTQAFVAVLSCVLTASGRKGNTGSGLALVGLALSLTGTGRVDLAAGGAGAVIGSGR